MTLFDLSSGNLALARQKAVDAGVTLAGIEQGTALDLGRFADASFDAVLLMGPLYHLLEERAGAGAGRGDAGSQARRAVVRRVHHTLRSPSRRGGQYPT